MKRTPTIYEIQRSFPKLDRRGASIIRQAMQYEKRGKIGPELEQFVTSRKLWSPADEDDRVWRALTAMNSTLGGRGVMTHPSNFDEPTAQAVPGAFFGLEYVNMGDFYDQTIVYDHGEREWKFDPWGHIIEADDDRFGEYEGWNNNPQRIPPGLQGLFELHGPVARGAYIELLKNHPASYWDIWNMLKDKQSGVTPADVLLALESLAREGAVVDLGGDAFTLY